MKDPKTALVVLDKPKHAQTALFEALSLREQLPDLRLHLASFVWLAMVDHQEVFDTQQRRALKRAALNERRRWLQDLILDQGLARADVTTDVVWTDDIAGWVADHVAGVDLVIKSVHKSRTLVHTPLDWELIRRCDRPLYLVGRRDIGRRAARVPANVLATVDLRHRDRKHELLNLRVLDAAARFAELKGGKLHCVSVVEYSEVLKDLEVIDTRKVRRQVIEATQSYLEALVEPFGITRNRIHRPAGKVGQQVAAIARKTDSGLVVVGSAARRTLGSRLLGGSAEKILSRSAADLLVVHP